MRRLNCSIESRLILALVAAILLGGPDTATRRANILYAANTGDNTIEKFTSGGVGSVFASGGLSAPSFLAFTDDAGQPLSLPVPEPATFVLAGMGIVRPGFLALRKKYRRA